MFTRESQYEDLKILYLESGFVTSDEANCGYEDYIFAVRKDGIPEKCGYPFEWLAVFLRRKRRICKRRIYQNGYACARHRGSILGRARESR